MSVELHPRAQTRPVTVREAWEGVPDDGTGDRVNKTTKAWTAMKRVAPGSDPYKSGEASGFSYKKLRWDAPSFTITKGGGAGIYHYWHPSEHRVITLAECKRVASFPDAYRFPDDIQKNKHLQAAWDRIGNSVPPFLARAIGFHLKEIVMQQKMGGVIDERPTARDPKSYAQTLEEAWQAHLAPRAPDAPTVISTFAGCGGSSLGYSMAGYRELLAVEWDAHAVECFRLNFPDVPVYHGDIAKLSVEECLELAKIQPGELDVFDGSPPCQGFSTAGRRQIDDPRNQLFREYVRLLQGLRPRAFVMENVSGMVKGNMRLLFVEILQTLKGCGYRVEARLLNAMYFGVPQARERMIFVGVREDLEAPPAHPDAETDPMSMRDAISDLETAPDELTPAITGKYVDYLPMVRQGQSSYDYDRTMNGKVSGKQNLLRGYYDRPSYTLPKINTGKGYATLLHPTQPRSLSITEAKRIGSFPESFSLVGKFSDRWARIGNSVPPLLMRAVSKTIRQRILSK
jgi:DNA (cytosine-5)-methyltransferase 1